MMRLLLVVDEALADAEPLPADVLERLEQFDEIRVVTPALNSRLSSWATDTDGAVVEAETRLRRVRAVYIVPPGSRVPSRERVAPADTGATAFSGRDAHFSRSTERLTQSGEHRQVGVKRDTLQSAHKWVASAIGDDPEFAAKPRMRGVVSRGGVTVTAVV